MSKADFLSVTPRLPFCQRCVGPGQRRSPIQRCSFKGNTTNVCASRHRSCEDSFSCERATHEREAEVSNESLTFKIAALQLVATSIAKLLLTDESHRSMLRDL